MFEGLTVEQARQFRAGIVSAIQAEYAKVIAANGGEGLESQDSEDSDTLET